MEKLIEYDGGIKVTLTGEHPTIYVTGFFPCKASPQQTTRAKGNDSPRLLEVFAEQDASSMVGGHVANCPTCKAARDAAWAKLGQWEVFQPGGKKPVWAGRASDGPDAIRRARDAGREVPEGSRAEAFVPVDLSGVPPRKEG